MRRELIDALFTALREACFDKTIDCLIGEPAVTDAALESIVYLTVSEVADGDPATMPLSWIDAARSLVRSNST